MAIFAVQCDVQHIATFSRFCAMCDVQSGLFPGENEAFDFFCLDKEGKTRNFLFKTILSFWSASRCLYMSKSRMKFTGMGACEPQGRHKEPCEELF